MSTIREYMIRANNGHAYFKDPDTGRLKQLLHAKKIEIKGKTETDKILELGKNVYSHVPGAVEYTGTIELYHCSDYFLEKQIEYAQGRGAPFFFDLQIDNGNITNRNSMIGRHHIIVKGVFIQEILAGYVGQDGQIVTGTSDFTAEGIELVTPFTPYKGFDLGNQDKI